MLRGAGVGAAAAAAAAPRVSAQRLRRQSGAPRRRRRQDAIQPLEPGRAPTRRPAPPAAGRAAAGAAGGARRRAAAARSAAGSAWLPPHYDKGFVLVSTPDDGGMPFRLVLNHVSQFKYTNSMATNPTYTDHNGVVHDVQQRNDIQLTRDVFYFSGYAFDPRLDYNILLFTSTATLVGDRGRVRGLRVQQGVRAARRVLLAAQLRAR